MLSIPPTTYEKTAYIKAALKRHAEMPPRAIYLTGRYLSLQSDLALALRPLQFDGIGMPTNPDILHAIREALISNVCDLLVKRQIFLNMVSDTGGLYVAAFNLLHNEIRCSGYTVNLDFVDLSRLNLIELDFDGMSLKYTNFTESCIHASSFAGADLRHAKFNGARLCQVNLTMTQLEDVNWDEATMSYSNLSGATGLDLIGTKELSLDRADHSEPRDSVNSSESGFAHPDVNLIIENGEPTPDPNKKCHCIVL